jgi:lysozyme
MNNMSFSENGLKLTESFEGLRLTAYEDIGGVLTIGYGHTGRDVYRGQVITQEQAESLLALDTHLAVAAVNHLVRVPLNQNQFDALVDFAFNLGAGALAGSHLLRYVNAGDFNRAAEQFPAWDHVNGTVSEGLYRRRIAERDLFNGSTGCVE